MSANKMELSHSPLPFAGFDAGTNNEPWDAGIIFIDPAARIVAAESSRCMPSAEGQVQYHNGMQATGVWLPYRAPDEAQTSGPRSGVVNSISCERRDQVIYCVACRARCRTEHLPWQWNKSSGV
jgi:hypothetical protein